MPRPAPLPLLQNGFRPFFLAGAAWAPVALAIWLAVLAGAPAPPLALPASAWHAHELLFGYGGAVIAGFLLTAVPNWTGRLPIAGRALLGLCALWLAARLGNLAAGALGPALLCLDVAFWTALATLTGREVLIGRNRGNLVPVALVTLLAVGCALSQAEALGAPTGELGRRAGLAAILVLIGLMGGRVVPSFTRNWLARQPGAPLPAPFGRVDQAALGLLVLAVAWWVIAPEHRLTATVLAAAGLALLVRLARWRGWATTAEPLVTILHLGYGWLGAGLLLHGLGGLLPGSVGRLATLHALTAGAIGTMTLAIMTRATLGHTGRALAANRATVALYAMVQLGAALRVLAPVLPLDYPTVLGVAAALWGGAFVVFVGRYGPMLLRPRPAAGPG